MGTRLDRRLVTTVSVLVIVALSIGCGGSVTPSTSGSGKSEIVKSEPAKAETANSPAKETQEKPAAESKAPILLGVILSTTGFVAQFGEEEKRAIQLAQEILNNSGGINGRKVELIFDDDEAQPAKTQILAKKDIEQGVVAILGPTTTAASQVGAVEAERARVPMTFLTPATQIWKDKKYIFSIPVPNHIDAQSVSDYVAASFNVKKVAILHDANEYGTDGADKVAESLKGKGLDIVARQKYQTTDTSVSSFLINIKNSGAEGLVIWGSLPVPSIALKEMKQMGMNIPVIGGSGLASPKLIELAGDAANGVIFTAALNHGAPLASEKEFVEKYSAKYGAPPTDMSAYGWDAFWTTVDAIKKGGAQRDKVRDELEYLKGYQGAIGAYNRSANDHNGLGAEASNMIKVADQKWTPIKK